MQISDVICWCLALNSADLKWELRFITSAEYAWGRNRTHPPKYLLFSRGEPERFDQQRNDNFCEENQVIFVASGNAGDFRDELSSSSVNL